MTRAMLSGWSLISSSRLYPHTRRQCSGYRRAISSPYAFPDPRHLAVDLPLEPRRARLRFERVGRDLAEHGARAVREDRGQLDRMRDREPVRDGVRTARVVAQHAADGGPVRRRGVGAEQQAHGPDVVVELVLDETGLHPGPELFLIHLQHARHVRREVEDDGTVHRLPGQRRPSATRKERRGVTVGDLDRGAHVLRMTRDDDADGLHLVHGRVGRVEQAE